MIWLQCVLLTLFAQSLIMQYDLVQLQRLSATEC